MYQLVVLTVCIATSMAYVPCTQRSVQDFRADDKDCSVFHVCSLGLLVPFRCSAGGVFDEHTLSCVPAHSVFDRCSDRKEAESHCPPGTKGPVAHSTRCTQYYECGATRGSYLHPMQNIVRECHYPLVYSEADSKCVQLRPGVCGARDEPMDPCDYNLNQCQTHSDCIPCHIRFPTCRGLPDGLNAWRGRQESPYYVTCHQQRVLATGVCDQNGAQFVFDEETKSCVKRENEEWKVPVPQRVPHLSFIPHQPSQQYSQTGQGTGQQYQGHDRNGQQQSQYQYNPNQNQEEQPGLPYLWA